MIDSLTLLLVDKIRCADTDRCSCCWLPTSNGAKLKLRYFFRNSVGKFGFFQEPDGPFGELKRPMCQELGLSGCKGLN